MGRRGGSRATIMAALVDGNPMSCREIIRETGLSRSQVYIALYRCARANILYKVVTPKRIKIFFKICFFSDYFV